ncbi:MAG TPA: hypothetical protein VKZ18_05225 [Polyangia bacterium]|nr:hypothetical protein [Polyangia bacterium]
MRRRLALAAGLAAAVLLGAAAPAAAHVGSPDAVADGQAGPYHLLVTIRPPAVVPGVAQIEVRALDADVTRVSVVPLPIGGAGEKLAPVPDVARPAADEPRRFDSTLWLMRTGAWQIRITAEGARGAGTLAVPIPAVARAVRPMPGYLGGMLIALMALIVAGAIAIVGAGLRESDLAAGASPDARRVTRGRTAMAVTAAILALAIAGGRSWWNDEARLYRRLVYKPMQVEVTRPTPDTLSLALSDPGWIRWRKADDLIPDHGHLMHLFVVRTPGLDAIAHLHPRRAGDATFTQATPPLPGGAYRLFGDIVHETGLDETVTSALQLEAPPALDTPPALDAARFDPDDAMAVLPRAATVAGPTFRFPDGGQLRWVDARTLHAGETAALEFEADAPDGQPAAGLEPYMGMAGHAMIVARDLSVFAHVHPTGSVPMAAMSLVDGASVVDHAKHHGMRFAPRVRFPYVFPHAGDYRLFVQIKENGRVETAAWDLQVAPPVSPRSL